MAHRTVDGLVVPRSVSGHPALELCNTRAGYDGAPAREYLQSYGHLSTVARANGLLTVRRSHELRALAAAQPDAAERVLRRSVRFRDDLYAVLTEAADPAQVTRLAGRLRQTAGSRRLLGVSRGRATWSPGSPPLAEPLDAFAWQAQLLLQDPSALGQLGRCPGHDCGWLFLDPLGRRRWCIMAICGNREKARRHAERSRSAHR
jgi:CGNR zinc finger/Putative stress-induced transcription regulator